MVDMDTKTRLLNSAEDLIRQRGYDGFSYSDVAEDVGIRKASIHHHFPTKADLGLEALRVYAERFTRALYEVEHQTSSAGHALTGYINLYRAALGEGKQLCLCVALSLGPDRLETPIVEALRRFHSDSLAWLERVLRRAQGDGSITLAHPREAASILALMEGAQLLARAQGDVKAFDQAVSGLLARLS